MNQIKHTLLTSLAIAAISVPASAADVPEPKRSKHFGAVSAHLDLGGDIYGYLDLDGDVEKLATLFQGFLDAAKEEAGGDVPPQIANLKLTELSADLGLSNIGALGLSSYKDGGIYRNKYYLHVPGGRTGFLKVLGGDAAPFAARGLAPAGSDIVVEQDIDLRSGFELVGMLALKYGGPEAAAEMAQTFMEPIGPGLTMANIFAHLDTKMVVVGQLHPEKPLPLPEDVPFKVPSFDLLVSFDGLGPIFTKLTATIPLEQRPHLLSEGPGFQQLTLPVPPEIAGMMQPVIRHEIGSGRVLIASSDGYLNKCLTATTTVWDDASFQSAMAGLPEEGNGLSFASADFFKEYLRLYGEILNVSSGGEMPPAIGKVVIELMKELGMSPDHSQGNVRVNLPDGILVCENSAASAKQTIAAAGAGFMAGFVGYFSFAQSVPTPYDIEMEETKAFDPSVHEIPKPDVRQRDFPGGEPSVDGR